MNKRLLMTPDLLARKRAEMLTDTAYEGRWRSLKRVAESNAMTESSREWLPTLAAMSLLTDEPKYAARAEVLLASAVNSGYTLISADRGKPVGQEVFQLAIAYDWLGDRLSPDMLARVGATLAAWGKWIWPETNFARAGAWGIDAPWDNYWMSFLTGSWLAGLALGDDALINLSRQKWQRGLAWILEHELGGFLVEGSTYGSGSLLALLQTLCANKTATGEELHPWFQSALSATFQLTTPGMGAKLPYGDAASDYKGVHSDTDRFSALLMAQFGGRADDAKAWLDGISRNRSKRAQSLWFEYAYYPS
jgi:hypothetical protein